ncbi:hypothetical protein P175DRAFT_0497471 [Aspergillus ochraceoroseus IBT 24754]|uniref:Uncharacterized protein n=1 Tax=Aspergillus ochraceoroseus IBT 24754 TaxID=1392256 RepID=A0A2T5M750_9EURO|nr:uncharacterized protein P175DRAFT_0497471 [Aspergillus ochraceoroseus IBT 24754]PTU24353.1 hypothetical protein P175DRAFT_0497471 [Aspergillus ochraceoroseus IBT 24754]
MVDSSVPSSNLSQPWKKNWPQGFHEISGLHNTERMPSNRASNGGGGGGGGGPVPGPQGGKGASPFACAMVDGTKVMRLDDKEVFRRAV